jgi:hypothetical protein
VLVVLATLGTSLMMTAQPAAATGVFTCQDAAGVPEWKCEITFNNVVVDGVAETEYTCTATSLALTVPASTSVECFIAVSGGISAVVASGLTGTNNVSWHSLPGATSTWGNVVSGSFAPPDYWVCIRASTAYLSGSDTSQNYCQTAPVSV